MTESRSARDVVESLLGGSAAGPTAALADLYAPDALVEIPFARPGGVRLEGRAAIAEHFARAGQLPLRLVPERIRFHETADPEVVIVDYDYRGEATSTGRTFMATNVQIVRVRDGLILTSRDFHDHAAIAAALRS